MMEIDYYPEITEYVQDYLEYSLDQKSPEKLHVFSKYNTELRKGIDDLIKEHAECACMSDYAKTVAPLKLDIFFVITKSCSNSCD